MAAHTVPGTWLLAPPAAQQAGPSAWHSPFAPRVSHTEPEELRPLPPARPPALPATGSPPLPLHLGSPDGTLPRLCQKAPESVSAPGPGGSPPSGQLPGLPWVSPACRNLSATSPRGANPGAPPPQLPPPGSPGSTNGSSFSTADLGERGARSPAGARGSRGGRAAGRRARVGAGRGARGGAASSSPTTSPIYLLGQGHGPAASALRGGLGAGTVSWRQAEQRGRAASSPSADAEPRGSGHRRRARAAPAARRSRPLPPLPRRPAGPLPPPPLLLGAGTRRARAGAETPARARDWEAGGGAVTWAGRPEVRAPGLRAPRSPPRRPPPPAALAPPARRAHSTRGSRCPRRGRPGDPSGAASGRRKGRAGGRMEGWRGGGSPTPPPRFITCPRTPPAARGQRMIDYRCA